MPNSRKEFERNMFFLSEGFEKDIVKVTISSRKTIKGIENARFGPNQRPNLNTVDQSARLFANTIAQMIQQKEFKLHENGEQ